MAQMSSRLTVPSYRNSPILGDSRAVVCALTDGPSDTAHTTLEAKAKNIRGVVQHTGHPPVGR
jgi:hypothetical protein